MTQSSILGGERAARRSIGKDVDALGPSDTSDSGSDVQGESAMATGADEPDELGALPTGMDNDSDASGTGERASATGRDSIDGADISPDRVLGSVDAADDVDEMSSDEDTDDDE
jgi:hypothetical protein